MQPYPGPYTGYNPPYVLVAPRPLVPPTPTGTPIRALFYVGAVGMFIIAATGIIGGILSLVGFGFDYGRDYPMEVVVIGILVLVASVISAIGYIGLYRNYGSAMGAASGIYLLIASSLFLAFTVAAIHRVWYTYEGYYDSYSYSYYSVNPWLYITGYVLFGIAPILLGVSHIVSRNHMTIPGLGISTGVLFIIAGSFIISTLLSFVGFIMLAPAGILGGINFVKAPIYSQFGDIPHGPPAHATVSLSQPGPPPPPGAFSRPPFMPPPHSSLGTQWECPNCYTVSTGQFCPGCGTRR